MATTEPYVTLLADFIGHPEGTPSNVELIYMNPSLDNETIRRHLTELMGHGVVEVVESEELEHAPELEWYQLTDDAQEYFDAQDIFPENALKRQYSRVQKPEWIKQIESLSL